MTKDIPLNASQIEAIVGKPIGMVSFKNIHNHKDINQVFGGKEGTLIHYETKPYMGHWCCIKKVGDTIYYFNPSGKFIDEAINFLPENYAKITEQDFPHLLKLLTESPYKVKWVDKRLQKPNSNTCGRWCALFLRSSLNEDQFIDLFKDMSNEDIINFTNYLSGHNKNNMTDLYKCVKNALDKTKDLEDHLERILDRIEAKYDEEKEYKDIEHKMTGEGEKWDKFKNYAKKGVEDALMATAPVLGPAGMAVGDLFDPRARGSADPAKMEKMRKGAETFGKFVSKYNKKPLFKDFKGKGKRTGHSIIYELKRDMKANGLNNFKDIYQNIEDNRPKGDHLPYLKQEVPAIRKELGLNKSKKIKKD